MYPQTDILWALFRALLGKEDLEVYFQGHKEEFAEHLMDKAAQTHFKLDSSFNTGPVEVAWV